MASDGTAAVSDVRAGLKHSSSLPLRGAVVLMSLVAASVGELQEPRARLRGVQRPPFRHGGCQRTSKG